MGIGINLDYTRINLLQPLSFGHVHSNPDCVTIYFLIKHIQYGNPSLCILSLKKTPIY